MDCRVALVCKSSVDGPGTRVGVWFQGCQKSCPGCFNQSLREVRPGLLNSVSDVNQLVTDFSSSCEGITLSGGEPLDQPDAVVAISDHAHKLGLSVMIYTGYEPESMPTLSWMALHISADIAVVGPYDFTVPQIHAWAGSGNQRIMLFSDRYSEKDVMEGGMTGKFEVRISPDGYVVVTGFPPRRMYGD